MKAVLTTRSLSRRVHNDVSRDNNLFTSQLTYKSSKVFGISHRFPRHFIECPIISYTYTKIIINTRLNNRFLSTNNNNNNNSNNNNNDNDNNSKNPSHSSDTSTDTDKESHTDTHKDTQTTENTTVENLNTEEINSSTKNSTSKPSNSSVASATGRAASALGSATLHYTYEFNKLYSDLERTVMYKVDESNRRRIRMIIISVIVGVVTLVVLFGSFIRKGITDGTADIAKETLENESLKIQTQELAMAVVQTILNDKEITSHAAAFLREASSVQETQTALLQLTLHVLQHPDSLKEVGELVKKLLKNLSEDKESISYIATILAEALQDPKLVNTIITSLEDMSVNPDFVNILTELLIVVAAKPEIVKAFSDLLSQSSQAVLADEKVVSQSRDFVAEVMGDDKIQREGGDAIWNSISHALRPGLKKLGGVALVAASLAVAQLLLSPY